MDRPKGRTKGRAAIRRKAHVDEDLLEAVDVTPDFASRAEQDATRERQFLEKMDGSGPKWMMVDESGWNECKWMQYPPCHMHL